MLRRPLAVRFPHVRRLIGLRAVLFVNTLSGGAGPAVLEADAPNGTSILKNTFTAPGTIPANISIGALTSAAEKITLTFNAFGQTVIAGIRYRSAAYANSTSGSGANLSYIVGHGLGRPRRLRGLPALAPRRRPNSRLANPLPVRKIGHRIRPSPIFWTQIRRAAGGTG